MGQWERDVGGKRPQQSGMPDRRPALHLEETPSTSLGQAVPQEAG